MTEDHRGKVPSWDGDPKTWRTYRRKALQYQEGTKREDRYLCGPRLEAKLTSRAEIAVERCKAGWLSRPDGVERLLAWLERRCSRQAVPDVGQELETFLIKTKRRKLEPMQQWTDRFETGYQYLRRALARALGHTVPIQVAPPWKRSGRPYRWIEVERDWPFEGSEWTWEYTDGLPDDEKKESHHWSAADQDADAEEELGDMPEVFPSLVLGWLMLVRSGLDSRERAAIMTATGGSLEVNIIREKLISSWEDDDLAERDGHSRSPKAYTAQLGEDDRTWLDGDDGPDASSFAADVENYEWQEEDPGQEEANDDEIDTYLAAQQEEAEALAAIHTAQRTLRQAREAQADSRLSRGFYRGGAAGTPEASAKVAECRRELKLNLVASLVAEQEPQDVECEAMFADQAIREGKGIVDLGLLDVNQDYRPVYSFGNGEKGRAYGQVKFGITGAGMEGDIAINGFSKDVPILVSKKVLKKLGAVVDCETGVTVFVKLAPDIPVQLEESPDGGHHYMSLVDDLLEQRIRDQNQLRNFKTICENISEWDSRPVAAVCQGPDSSSDTRAQQLERYMYPSQSDHSVVLDESTVGSHARAMRPLQMPTSRSAVQGLYKAEVLHLLQELGLPCSPAWGVDELKQVLKGHMFPKDETPAQVAMKGLSSMKKSQLLVKAEEVGAHVTHGMTNPSPKLSIRKAILMKHAPEPTDHMGFGKHGAMTYQQVRSQYPSYASWCQKESNKESSWELARFASWLNEQENIDEKAEVTRDPKEVPKEPVQARGGARSSRRRTVDAIMEDEIVEQERLEAAIKVKKEEKESNRLVQEQVLAALNQLNQRIGLNCTKELDPRKQRWLAKCIKENGHLEDYEALVAHGGTKLMEVACNPTSILSTKMAKKFGEDAVCRISAWNGFKLGTNGGNQRAREARDEAEPDHLWISTRCGPLSNLTLGFNGSNPIRAEATRKRRMQAIKEYKGAVQLVYDQVAQGKHVHWEWPIKCEGWGHTMIRKMVEDCSMTVVKVAGCQLGVKDTKGLPLLQEWLIEDGGGLTAATSYYPDEFARRAVRAMIEEAAPDYHEFLRCLAEPEKVIDQAMAANQEETKMNTDVNSKEYQQIMKWLTSIHRGSGHSSKAPMLNALRRKGASPQVLQVAKDFHCDACEEANKFKPTHPPVSLEAIPPKWKHIQADQFEWGHPQTKVKSKISLIINDNCRVRVSKLLYHMVGEDRHRNPVWADLKLFYEERWMPYFGKPQRVKVDPEGSWMSKQAAGHFDSDSIGYEPIPGQAHWHISLAEEAIQAAKGTMDKLAAENPEMTTGTRPGRTLLESDFDELPYVEAQRVDKEYGENYARMYAAEQEYLRQVYMRRLSRAENAKNQAVKSAVPGMWARYFRKEKGEAKGRFKGLARVLATETARPVDGDLGEGRVLHPGRAGSVVWLVRAGRIIKVDFCQIRTASSREIACAELMGGKDTPWTVHTFMNQALNHEYLDFTGHDPTENDVEISTWEGLPVPLEGKPLKQATRHMSTYMASLLRKGKREISERWILDRKMDENTGAKKPKARNAVLGYMDSEYEHRPTTAPTMTRTSRHLVLQAMAWLGFKGYKADVTGAFTQNREIQHDLCVMPVKELAAALGMPEGVAMRLRKAVYGLVEAAIEWFMTVSEALEEFGWAQMKMDPCVWVLYGDAHGKDTSFTKEALKDFTNPGVLEYLIAAKGDLDIIAIAGSHVDDFLLGGNDADPRWITAREQIEKRFKWKAWESEEFMQTGVRIKQQPDRSFRMDQSEYVKTIEKAYLTPERKKAKDMPTTDKEKGQLRAILGAIGWRSEQSGPMHSADASLLLSTIPSSTVQTINETNRLVDRVRECADLPVVIHSHSQSQVLVPVEWSDSSEANRPDGKSTKGLVAGLAPLKILKGDEADVSLISCKPGKIDRGCRSSVACETRSAVDAEDELFGIKLQWLEILGNNIDWRSPEGVLRRPPPAVVVDSKGLYDKLQTTVYTFRGKEKRTDVEAMTLKLRMCFNNGHRWKLVYDEKYQSARKRKAAGIQPFEHVGVGILKTPCGSTVHVNAAAGPDFPPYEAMTECSSDEEVDSRMLSLEDPYLCNSEYEQ
ncbi:unnamed protein product, partial [Prorocentrum cordatum]